MGRLGCMGRRCARQRRRSLPALAAPAFPASNAFSFTLESMALPGWMRPICAWRSTTARTGLPLLVHAEVAGPSMRPPEAQRVERGLAQVFHLSGLAARRCRSRSHRPAHPPGRGVRRRPSTSCILSSAKALPLLADARRRGLPITVETCVQYLWFAAEEIPDGATEFKCAPPIRDAANREALVDRAQ